MTEVIYVVIMVFAMVGFGYLFQLICCRLSSKNCQIISLLPLSGHIDGLECKIRTLLWQQRMQKLEPNNILILVDHGLDIQTRDICEKIDKDFDNVIVCDDCQVGNLIERGLERYT